MTGGRAPAPIGIRQLTATLGAEVTGVDLAEVDGPTLGALRRIWIDHKVLVIRDQHISREQHIAFGRQFGELEIHPFATGTLGDSGHEEIVQITSTAERLVAANTWHSDVTWREEPSMGSILRGVVIPPVGGDTCFADTAAAYDRLSDEWKARVDDKFAVHDFVPTFGRGVPVEKMDEMRATYPVARHPVIRTHPETGARGIYTNRPFTTHIDGVEADESEEILRRLERSIMDPSVQCRIRWEVDTFVMWDNRAVQHYATDDYWPETRTVERVTVVGDRPY
ncbi:MAG: TauD/TfdA family dioxygenase [Actinomycetia bacterium]|nr:TauD/TfdA family dioxygenase [Actinomycetes bacterium]